MVNRRLIARCAALCVCAAMMSALPASAEEKRLGDFIYVPAMQVQTAAGSIGLRVEGLELGAGSDEAETVHALAGAEFGVYVISSAGELTPWANPLYPSEQMRIRTGEGETRFTLPQGAEYYLIQESAPQGYLFDPTQLIPVTGEEIVVQNAMEGQLAISAVDSLGVPLAGVHLSVTGEDGEKTQLVTDENGEAVLACDQAQRFEIEETALPEGVFDAIRVSGAETVEGSAAVAAETALARRTRVVFEHPASGSVLLDMKLSVLDDNAQTILQPLAGVRLDILSEPPVSVVTDEAGQARASLLEGTYGVTLRYEGDEQAILPIQEGQMIVSSGSTTVIELNAVQPTGRVALIAQSEKAVSGGSFVLIEQQTGESFGPYALDAEGMAVSAPLDQGQYMISWQEAPQGAQIGEISCEGQTAQLIPVEAGRVTQAFAQLLTQEKQSYALVMSSVGEQGEKLHESIGGALSMTLIGEQGEEIARLESGEGLVHVEALSGTYALKMEERDAERLGVQPVSGLFALPSGEETIVFTDERTRLALASVDENGEPAPGAVYLITDSTGDRVEVACDGDGLAVSPLIASGSAYIETVVAPDGYDMAKAMTIEAVPGEAAEVQVVHERHGLARVAVKVRSLDEQGEAVFEPLAGVSVEIDRADGGLNDRDVSLVTDASGMAEARLEAGEYTAKLIGGDLHESQPVRIVIENTKETDAELICLADEGGVRVRLTGGELSDEELAQVRFELHAADGTVRDLTGGAFYAGGLPAGEYVLHQTQMPQGYALTGERAVTIEGGVVAEVSVPLEEYAVLTVSKTGLTFDDAMNTYMVPLSGQYGVYTMENGELTAYPSAAQQATLWANVTPHEMAMGKAGSAKLPASIEGTTYYLREIGSASGFAADESYHEVTLRAGETMTLDCAVSSDRGFFRFEALDALSGGHVPGGSYELIDALSGEPVLSFVTEDVPYQNPMAVPVGSYVLRQTKAAPGYALSVPHETDVAVMPYLTQGGAITDVTMTAAPIPHETELSVIQDLYAAQQQGLTLLTVDLGKLGAADALVMPALTLDVGAAGSERSDVESVVISGVGDASGGRYMARVEYCLQGGGWQPSDARMTPVLEGPTAVSLDDVEDDISAVRVTYISANTGEEAAAGGFTPGQVTLSLEASAHGDVNMIAHAAFEGLFAYQTVSGGETHVISRGESEELRFVMQASGLFETVSAGYDGRISGRAFFDEDADGVMDLDETERYAGMTVSLMTESGDVVNTVRTNADGSYAFNSISAGAYRVAFDAGERVVFSCGGLQSAHRISGVEDTRFGMSGLIQIDGDHTDYVVNVGCIYAAMIDGVALERMADGSQSGFAGLTVEMRPVGGDADDEPLVVVSGGMGEFRFGRILPGRYEVTMTVPQGYLCQDAEDGRITKVFDLVAGDSAVFGAPVFEKSASVYGVVRIDEGGDGVIEETADVLSGVRVTLLRAQDGHTQEVAMTVTDANGLYAFESLYPGEYSVLFELGGEWAFTRYGEDSLVYGAASQMGSTKNFTLNPGQEMTGVNAGVTIPAKMTVSVFKDTQYDGQKGVYEEMLEGVSISLIRLENGEDAQEITKVTDAEGSALFEGLSPGEYVLAYQMPGQWRSTRQIDPQSTNYPVSAVPQSTSSSGRSLPFVLTMGQTSGRMYIGAMLSGAISGTVYYDDNNNAKQDEGEAANPGVTAQLLSGDGEMITETLTGEDGSYAFEGLAPGRYSVRFAAQEGCGFSGTERTSARGGVQESDQNISSTRSIAVSAGMAVNTAHAGVVRLGSIEGLLWEDSDADRKPGQQERGMEGLTVNLMDGAGRNILAKAQTDSEGRFAFPNLKPGTYKLRADSPEGYVFSGGLDGSALPLESERDGRGYSASFTLLGGAHVKEIGFGLLTQGVISGSIWEDRDFDGVWDPHETGLRGAHVALIDETGSRVAARQTIRSGEFSFDQLMPGAYTLSVTLGEGYAFTAEGGESIAPHAAIETADIPIGTLSMGGTISDLRIGALRTAGVSGVVWYDQDDDGRRQDRDEGMPGVRAVLRVTGGKDAGKVYETTTDASGAYRFDDVMPGSMKIEFELLNGYAFGKRIAGDRRVSTVPKENARTACTDEFTLADGEKRSEFDVAAVGVGTVSGRVWEDAAYDGRHDENEPGVGGVLVELVDRVSGQPSASAYTDETGAYTIEFARVGEYVLRMTLDDRMIFTTAGDGMIAGLNTNIAQSDAFRLAMGESAQDMNAGAIVPAALSGRLVLDENEDGVGAQDEPGFAGGMVAVMQGGTAIDAARVGQDGSFSFNALRPGEYRLRVTLDDGALYARGVQLTLTNPDALEGETGEYALALGQQETIPGVPVVKAAEISGRSFTDVNVNGVMDAGETALSDVMAELLDANGQPIASVRTGDSGEYRFNQLRSGTYSVRFTLPDAMLFTEHTGADGTSCVPVVPGNVAATDAFALAMGEEKANMNVGGILPGRIGDTIWLDTDGNGLQDYKEPLLADVTLTLLSVGADGSMQVAATATSDQYGYYWFSALRPGTYVLRFDAKEGDTLTFSFGEPLEEIDSNIDPDTGLSAPIILQSGQTIRHADVGLTEHGK